MHHELNLKDAAAFDDRMGAQLPEGQVRGRRVRDTDKFAPGDYGRHPADGNWYACAPNGHLGNLSQHDVVEHEDSTITVSPSILITTRDTERRQDVELWHGYLEHGIWRTA